MSTNGRILTVGTAATQLDIFVTAGQNGLPLDPTTIRFRIFDPTGAEAVTETDGAKVSTGVYNASGAIIPAGYQLGDNWSIVWDIVTPSASGQSTELFSVADAQLSTSFANPAGNSIESLFDRVRLDIGDPDGMIFVDGLLSRTLKKAVSRLNRRLGLVRVKQNSHFLWFITFTSCSNAITLNLADGTIDPDTDPYADLLVLQMEEILLTSETVALQRLNQRTAGAFGSGMIGVAGDGVSATNADGVTISKAATRLTHRSDLAKFNLGALRQELSDAIKEFKWLASCGINVTIPRLWGYHGHHGYHGRFRMY